MKVQLKKGKEDVATFNKIVENIELKDNQPMKVNNYVRQNLTVYKDKSIDDGQLLEAEKVIRHQKIIDQYMNNAIDSNMLLDKVIQIKDKRSKRCI